MKPAVMAGGHCAFRSSAAREPLAARSAAMAARTPWQRYLVGFTTDLQGFCKGLHRGLTAVWGFSDAGFRVRGLWFVVLGFRFELQDDKRLCLSIAILMDSNSQS